MSAPSLTPQGRGRFPRLAALVLVLSILPLGLLTYSSIKLASDAVGEEVEARVRATAANSSELVRGEVRSLGGLVESYAARPSLITAMGAGDPRQYDRDRIAFHLRDMQATRPGIYTTFLADPSGKLIEIVPATPLIVGKDFSFRDWYKGVTSTRRTYVSEAYETQASGNALVVAVAGLVHGVDDDGSGKKVLGILVAAYSLDHIQSISTNLAAAQGVTLKVTDQRGTLLAAPEGAPDELVSRLGDRRVAAALAGQSGVTELDTPDGRRLSAYAPVPDIGWTVTASVPADTAFAAIGKLRLTVLAIASGLGLALLVGFVFLFRTLRARERAEAEAHRLADINRVVLDSTKDVIVLFDAEGRIVLANVAAHRMAELFGVRAEGSFVDLAAEIKKQVTDPEAYAASARAITSDPQYEGEFEYELADSGRSFQRYTAPVRNADGRFTGRIVTIRETTPEREAERLKSELVATVSHELRTPLASILGFSELLVTRDLDAETRERYLQTIYKEASRLTALINDFLDLQKMEEGAFTLDLEPFDLREVLRHEVDVFSGQSAAHTIALDELAEPLVVAGERDRVAQVLGNLLSNAIKYSPEGGLVDVRAKPADGIVRVSVSDRGLGIPTAQQGQIFTKFFRVDSSDTRKIGGTGLGLALTREIVEAHGGRIGFDSVEGKGTTFWFELPSGIRRDSGSGGDGRPSVLVVEDDPSAAALLLEHLRGEGFAGDVATTGEQALERVRTRPPALVCLDVRLGDGIDGWQVLSELKAHPETAGVPVMVVTAYNSREKAAALGAADFITKPFTAERLRETVNRLLPHGGRSVLVVDDEENVRRLVVETLGDEGLELIEAADGEEALAKIAERRPDAIVLDLVMPNLDGFAVLERLQDNPSWRSVPVIVLTAHRLSPDERKSLQTRTVSLLEKSAYSGAELRRLIDRALTDRRPG